MNIKLDLACDLRSVEVGKRQEVTVLARVHAPEPSAERKRPPLTIIFVLDASGSMDGEPLAHLKRSVRTILELCAEQDRVGMVLFSSEAKAPAPPIPLDARGRHILLSVLEEMRAEGGTNLEAGLRLGLRLAPPARPGERVVLLLLSDGQPNVGLEDAGSLSRLAVGQRGTAVVATLGFGPGHSEPVLSAIAEGGGGSYYYVRDPALSTAQFSRALGAQADVVARGVRLSIEPAPGVRLLDLLPLAGAEGRGVRLPDLAPGARFRVAARLEVAAGAPGEQPLVSARLDYTPVADGVPASALATLALPAASGASERVPEVAQEIELLRAEQARRRARALGDEGRFSEAEALLRAHIRAVEELGIAARGDGSLLGEALDQLEDDRQMFATQPDHESWAEFRRGQALSAGGDFGAGAGRTAGTFSAAQGALPRARLVHLRTGKAEPLLKPVNVLGRARGCEVVLPSNQVSRQSAVVVAQDGEFWLECMGAANGVWVRGTKINVHKLRPGDEFQVGDYPLRYELDPAEPRSIP